MPITITAKHDGYRRCGIVHSTQSTTYPDDRFGASDLDRLRTDPHLIIVEHAELQASPADPSQPLPPLPESAYPAHATALADIAAEATTDEPAAAERAPEAAPAEGVAEAPAASRPRRNR